MVMMLLCLLINVQCCVVGMPLRDFNESAGSSSYHVSMRLFHEMYSSFCRMGVGNCFFRDMEKYDPARPENGNKTLEQRYREWLEKNGLQDPLVGTINNRRVP